MIQGWAKFWPVDLHVHTPGSNDANDEDFGSPEDIVATAIRQGLSAIAITDHNTASWVDQMSAAAKGSGLVVLPGFELSTSDGHLLGIWEEDTPAHVLEDVLISIGIQRAQFGSLDVVARGMADCAAEITKAGGIAIAAHIDKEKGLLAQPVQVHVNQLLADPEVLAFEFVKSETPAKVAAKLNGSRKPALVQSSDAYDASLSRHAASGIGIRRTWIKAARPDLIGLRYALDDPELRVTLDDPSLRPQHPTIDSVYLSGGFLPGETVELSPDLNCFLGGTGAGKSLVLEATRFALHQQVDGDVFEAIRDEVDRRLGYALGDGTEVQVNVTAGGERYRISRVFETRGSQASVLQEVDGDWVAINAEPEDIISIAPFSQGEILEYARQPVGRVGLVDAHLDMREIEDRISHAEAALDTNADSLIAARERVSKLTEQAAKETALADRERELSALFDPKLVEEQGQWTSERGALQTLEEQLEGLAFTPPTPPTSVTEKLEAHKAYFDRISDARASLLRSVADAKKLIDEGIAGLRKEAGSVRSDLDAEFKAFQAKLDETLEKSGNASLTSLRRSLEKVQTDLAAAKLAAAELNDIAQPDLDRLLRERDDALSALKKGRDERRDARRDRVKELNSKTAGFVKIDIPTSGDRSAYRTALDTLKVGSRLQDQVLALIADHVHPFNLGRVLWSGDFSSVGTLPTGLTVADLSKLHANVADRELWKVLLETQRIDIPDMLDVKFKKPEGGAYVPIENLSHGQKCTAVLIILLADGETPVLIDQPEDALHAPWIEDYLVDRLRDLRGTRQYIFATRSAGLVVSADAEQLITMRATADRGEVEASGSLERHDLNALALHHLEGGKVPFGRRARKLRTSISS